MARAGYADVVTDSFGNRLAGASVEVRLPGTTTKVAGPLYADPTSAATLTNPFTTNGLGYFALYLASAQTVDLYVTAPGYNALTAAGVAVGLGAPVLDGSQLVDGSVTSAKIADGTIATADLADGAVTSQKIADGTITDADVAAANKDGAATTPSLRTLGAGAQQAAAGNHAHSLAQHPAVPRCRVYHSAAQSIPNGTVSTLSFDGERYDTDTMHDTATQNSRLTCRTAGLYVIHAHVEFALNATGERHVILLLNGATQLAYHDQPALSTNAVIVSVSTQYPLAVGDYVECQVYQNSGGALNVNVSAARSPEFAMAWVGP
jgi:hypothetical protein